MQARTGARLALGLAVSGLACLLVINSVDVSATAARLSSVQPGWLLVPLVALALQLLVRARRWAILLAATSGTPVRTGRIVGPLAVGYLANGALPARVGEVARAVLVARREHLAIAAVAASVVVERVVDLVALLSIGLVSTWTVGIGAIGALAIAMAAVLVSGLGVLAVLARPLAARVPRRMPDRLRRPAVQFLTSIGGVGFPAALAAFGLSLLAWMGDVTLVWACMQSLGLHLGLSVVVPIAIGAALGTALPAASGYLGTYELGAVTFGTLFGAAPDTVLSIALLSHVLAVVPTAAVGLVSGLRMGIRFGVPGIHRPAGGEAGLGVDR
jgi:uncharacterized membrane protein YbhN (UPF0104 family)